MEKRWVAHLRARSESTADAIDSRFKNSQAGTACETCPRPVDMPRDGDAAASCSNCDLLDRESSNSKSCSPPVSRDHDPEATSQNPNIRSGARNTSGRQLWTEEDSIRSKKPQGRSVPVAPHPSQNKSANKFARPSQPTSQSTREQPSEGDAPPQMMLQPETRPISQDQLVAEVKGIYAGLVMVETKCIEVDNAQSSNNDANKLNNEQWQALIALHRTLLHEHHDFFLASQHPSASPPLRRLASKYAMPARMWRHGIHSFLELLRHRLPESLEHMLTFLYLAYSMMALLYETVPTFVDTWIECLGDLGRYRMAIEDDDIRDREVWTGVSRHWYSKASDNSPPTGRLYHHLAILARPNALQQLYQYTKSLCVSIPFLSAKESIMTLFDPVLDSISRLSPIAATFGRVHGILFSGKEKCHPFPQGGLLSYSVSSLLAISGRLFDAFGKLPPKAISLGLVLLWTQPAYGSEDRGGKSDESQDIPGWVFLIAFVLITSGFEAAGRCYEERRKWYLVEMVGSNISFPLLATDSQVSWWVTGSLLAVNVYLACSYALIDYEELSPGIVFYLVATFFGFFISALIGSTSQSNTGLSSGSRVNTFWVYLPVSMTMSIVIGGRLLVAYNEWLDKERKRARDQDQV